jgi:hypothetical protein
MKHATLIAFSVASVVSSLAAATGQDAHPLRYRLDAVPSPAAADTSCLPGHTTRTIPRSINDFGSVAADYTCYIADFNGIPASQSAGQAFVWSPWLGTRLIPRAADARGVNSQSVNNRGDVFGREFSLDGSTYGFRSTLFGAYERVFESPPECSKIDGAAAGNLAGYIVGFGLRADPSGACAVKWLIRTPASAISVGPVGGQPWDINSWNVAVGDAGSAAVRFHVPSGSTRVLFAGDATTFGRAQDINDDGEVAGYLSLQNKFCGQATAVSWDQFGRMRALPHLAGKVSSRALGIGDAEVVGQSGAGQYCTAPYSETERAVIWKRGEVVDLNALIPQWHGVTVTRAVGVNRAGQILAQGFRNDEPLTGCPVLSWDENDNPVLDYSTPCRNLHSFVLTPVR